MSCVALTQGYKTGEKCHLSELGYADTWTLTADDDSLTFSENNYQHLSHIQMPKTFVPAILPVALFFTNSTCGSFFDFPAFLFNLFPTHLSLWEWNNSPNWRRDDRTPSWNPWQTLVHTSMGDVKQLGKATRTGQALMSSQRHHCRRAEGRKHWCPLVVICKRRANEEL